MPIENTFLLSGKHYMRKKSSSHDMKKRIWVMEHYMRQGEHRDVLAHKLASRYILLLQLTIPVDG